MREYKCKGCGRPIVWIKTPGGKSMPCDPEPTLYWPPARGSRDRIVTKNGEVLACRFTGAAGAAAGLGFRPHWGTCRSAGEFKRPTKYQPTGNIGKEITA